MEALAERAAAAEARAREFVGESVIDVEPALQQEAAEAAPRMLRDRPSGPTRQKREEHCRTHEPYRAWCRACVAGRGRADPHHLRDEAIISEECLWQ